MIRSNFFFTSQHGRHPHDEAWRGDQAGRHRDYRHGEQECGDEGAHEPHEERLHRLQYGPQQHRDRCRELGKKVWKKKFSR